MMRYVWSWSTSGHEELAFPIAVHLLPAGAQRASIVAMRPLGPRDPTETTTASTAQNLLYVLFGLRWLRSGARQRETAMTPRATTELDGVYRKIFQRLVPFLMLLWVLA